MIIGILALQGSYEEHKDYFERCGANVKFVKEESHLNDIDGLVLSGGESTAIRRLIDVNGLLEPLKEFCSTRPVFGTCAGMILLAKNVEGNPTHIGVLDVTVKRNAFGRQAQSFEETIELEEIGSVEAVYIRAPYISTVGTNVKVLGKRENAVVAVRQNNILATSFHPELTNDLKIGKYFMNIIDKLNK